MKVSVCLILFIFFLLPVSPEPTVLTENLFPHYEMDLEIEPDTGQIKGTVVISFAWSDKWSSTENEIYLAALLNLYEEKNPYIFSFIEKSGPKGFSPALIRIQDIKVNHHHIDEEYLILEEPVFQNYNTEHILYKIRLPFTPEEGETLQVSFNYEAQLPYKKGMDDFYFKERMFCRFFWFPYLLSEENIDNKDIQLRYFTYQAKVKVSPAWELAAVGTGFNKDFGNTYTLESSHPVLSLPLVLLKECHMFERPVQNTDQVIRVYYFGDIEGTVRQIESFSQDALAHYAEVFFPLDYKYISVVQGNPGTWGMASDSVIIIGDGFFSGVDRGTPNIFAPFLNYLISHEMGHFYFGIGSQVNYLEENYLSEGFTEYFSIQYQESLYGYWDNLMSEAGDVGGFIVRWAMERQLKSLNHRGTKQYAVYRIFSYRWNFPLSHEHDEIIYNTYAVTDYDVSFFVLNMLAYYLGQESFDEAVRELLLQNRYTPFDSNMVKDFLEEYYEKDLSGFFNTFVFNSNHLDYELTGELNSLNEDGGYNSTLTVTDKNNTGIFIPVKLTLFYKDGSTEESLITGPGSVSYNRQKKIKYAGIDIVPVLLDTDRRNNFYPRQVRYKYTKETWLKDFGAVICSLPPYIEMLDDYINIGIGPRFEYPLTWELRIAPYISIALDLGKLMSFDFSGGFDIHFGTALTAAFTLPRFHHIGTKMLYNFPKEIQELNFTYIKSFYFHNNAGYVGKTFFPNLSLGLSSGLSDFPIDKDSDKGYLYNRSFLSSDFSIKFGLKSYILNEINYHFLYPKVEDRISLSLTKGFGFIPRVLLGFRLYNSFTFGEITRLYAHNSVLGWDNTAGKKLPYMMKVKGFIGLPLINNLDVSLFNWVVLQSINWAIVYEGAFPYSHAKDFFKESQHAIGIEILTLIRTFADMSIPLALGVSFNLTDITRNPGDPSSYIPAIYIGLDDFSILYNVLSSY